ncbi:hypothetical protein DCAR_0832736 [Daucus carota subsp. sativus]|uniref:Knottins-like domain-containing protein n=1 Tax=Daucus carota subsp. sativus TaxID=79200 RepID=A0AAF0XTU4_DAUCS|nr:hypothetical protein DCAR_0832736 [Daucus carota subsp. sativus]
MARSMFIFLIVSLLLMSCTAQMKTDEDLGSMIAGNAMCKTPSRKFHGLCFSNQNCADICQTEGFLDGECEGFRRRCFCIKPC